MLLNVARFTTGYVRLVGQEPALSKCVLLSTSRVVRKDMKDFVLSQEGDSWSVKFGVRDLGGGGREGNLDTTFRGWSSTLTARVRLVFSRLILIFLPLWIFMVEFVWSGLCICLLFLWGLGLLCLPLIVFENFDRVSTGLFGLAVSLWLVLVLPSACWMGPLGVILLFCVVWFRFRLLRRYLALWPSQIGRAYRLLEMVGEGSLGHGPIHLLSASAAETGFRLDPLGMAWSRLGLPLLSNLAGPVQHFKTAILEAWRNKVAADLCGGEGFSGWTVAGFAWLFAGP